MMRGLRSLHFPSIRFTISHAGGIVQIGSATIEWANAVSPGTQLMGAPSWGWTAIILPTGNWFFGG